MASAFFPSCQYFFSLVSVHGVHELQPSLSPLVKRVRSLFPHGDLKRLLRKYSVYQ
ncbi:hypothetical protein ACTXT7_005742 [Hymenolepis weldensis]